MIWSNSIIPKVERIFLFYAFCISPVHVTALIFFFFWGGGGGRREKRFETNKVTIHNES